MIPREGAYRQHGRFSFVLEMSKAYPFSAPTLSIEVDAQRNLKWTPTMSLKELVQGIGALLVGTHVQRISNGNGNGVGMGHAYGARDRASTSAARKGKECGLSLRLSLSELERDQREFDETVRGMAGNTSAQSQREWQGCSRNEVGRSRKRRFHEMTKDLEADASRVATPRCHKRQRTDRE